MVNTSDTLDATLVSRVIQAMDRSVLASDIAGFSESDWFVDLGDGAAARMIAAATDLAMVVDGEGIVRDLSYSASDPQPAGMKSWIGRPWSDLVTIESRGKVEALLRDANANAPTRGREINHASKTEADVPIRFSTFRMDEGHVLALGKDLRSVSVLQQQLVEAQLMLDREYARVRNVETRYRLLFQLSSEAILILDDATEKVSEANAAAGALIGQTPPRLIGRLFSDFFDGQSAANVRKFIATARTLGHSDPVRVRLADGRDEMMVSASTFHQENATYLLVRLTGSAYERAGFGAKRSRAQDAIMKMPDGFVVVDGQQRILEANPAFLSLVELTSLERVKGMRLDSWLGRPGVDAQLLISNLKDYGWLKDFSTILRGEFGGVELVEVTGVAASDGEEPCYGLIVRAARKTKQTGAQGGDTFRSVEQLTELVGRVSLKELVRESTDLIEKLCIEAALKRTDDNRASAAQILGLSRQSLYSKLHRHGLLTDDEIVDDA